jgi:hypothetical protein
VFDIDALKARPPDQGLDFAILVEVKLARPRPWGGAGVIATLNAKSLEKDAS